MLPRRGRARTPKTPRRMRSVVADILTERLRNQRLPGSLRPIRPGKDRRPAPRILTRDRPATRSLTPSTRTASLPRPEPRRTPVSPCQGRRTSSLCYKHVTRQAGGSVVIFWPVGAAGLIEGCPRRETLQTLGRDGDDRYNTEFGSRHKGGNGRRITNGAARVSRCTGHV